MLIWAPQNEMYRQAHHYEKNNSNPLPKMPLRTVIPVCEGRAIPESHPSSSERISSELKDSCLRRNDGAMKKNPQYLSQYKTENP